MKKLLVLLLMLFLGSPMLSAQEKLKENDIEVTQAINWLISKKMFTFHATRIISTGGNQRYLNLLNTFHVTPDSLIVKLPYIGKGFSSDIGGFRNPLQFVAKDYTYDIREDKRGNRIITIDTQSPNTNDRFTFVLTISKGIMAKLMVIGAKRSQMQFSGYIQGNDLPLPLQ